MTKRKCKQTSNLAAVVIRESQESDVISKRTPILLDNKQKCTVSWTIAKENQKFKESLSHSKIKSLTLPETITEDKEPTPSSTTPLLDWNQGNKDKENKSSKWSINKTKWTLWTLNPPPAKEYLSEAPTICKLKLYFQLHAPVVLNYQLSVNQFWYTLGCQSTTHSKLPKTGIPK